MPLGLYINMCEWLKNNKYYAIAIIFILGLLAPYFYKFGSWSLPDSSEQWDAFGSYIGGIFSALAFLAVITQMQLDRKKFAEEKSEQDKQRKKDEFERTFFMMLEQHNLKISSIESNIDDVYEELIGTCRFESARSAFDVGRLNKEYANINGYFLNLYRILRFIHNNKRLNVNKEYSGLLRSFLSRKLLTILAFHLCKRDKSYDDFIGYINEFSFLEHIDLIYLESLMLSKSMPEIGQINIYQNLLALESMNEEKLDGLISNLNHSNIGPVIVLAETRSTKLLECYKFILSIKMKGEQLNIDSLNDMFKSDFFFNSLFLAIIKRFDKKAFEGNRYIESILFHYKKYLNQEVK